MHVEAGIERDGERGRERIIDTSVGNRVIIKHTSIAHEEDR